MAYGDLELFRQVPLKVVTCLNTQHNGTQNVNFNFHGMYSPIKHACCKGNVEMDIKACKVISITRNELTCRTLNTEISELEASVYVDR